MCEWKNTRKKVLVGEMTTAWIDARHPMASRRMWGLTVLERNVRELVRLGVTEITVSSSADDDPIEHFSHALPDEVTLSRVVAAGESFAGLTEALERGGRLLVLQGHALNDRRLIQELVATRTACAVVFPGQSRGVAAVVRSEHAPLFESGRTLSEVLTGAVEDGNIEAFDLSGFEAYIPNMRRTVLPFLLPIEDEKTLREADDRLRSTVQKGVLEFVAKYLHPPLEFGVVRRIAHTRITPNMITGVVLVLSALSVASMAAGRLLAACGLAAVVGVLDGVDGKLARLTVRSSKIGNHLDHAGGALFEGFWYLALGWHFATIGTGPDGTFAVILVISYVVEKTVPGIFQALHGAEIHDYKDLDIKVRLIGSRMNNNVWVLLIGVLLGYSREMFYFVSVWMLATAGWHTLRLLYVTFRTRSRVPAAAE